MCVPVVKKLTDSLFGKSFAPISMHAAAYDDNIGFLPQHETPVALVKGEFFVYRPK